MNRSETLFFTGHRELYFSEGSDAFALLYDTILSFYKKGYKNFICGGALGFDTAAAECVIRFKERYTDAALVLILPCKNQAEMWGYSDRARYERILGRADAVSYVGEEYRRGCMHERNRAMVHESSACIAYCKRNSGGSAYTVAYAQKMGLSVINLANSL